jgi:hypothetical protein
VTLVDERADEVVVGSWMDSPTKQLLLEAGQAAKVIHPGAVGELLSQELLSWMVFGHRLGSALIMRVAAEVLAENVEPSPIVPWSR